MKTLIITATCLLFASVSFAQNGGDRGGRTSERNTAAERSRETPADRNIRECVEKDKADRNVFERTMERAIPNLERAHDAAREANCEREQVDRETHPEAHEPRGSIRN